MSSEIIEEKTVTINLRKAYLASGKRAAPRAINIIRNIAKKIADTDEIKISNEVNMAIWSRGKGKTLRKISIKVQKLKDGTANVILASS
ncbi:MAG: 60S ribosomal protein L31 [Candidatus Methanomethylicia archaeon]|jgi:large subunit ribosomal protein L31e|uniref:Large ribosomal subunit protein eL31 n=1 Tax=Thermoproteota archaeon TaxID=2056631 RepID=A0A523BGW0_9CREN|nr:60S ribosomal protein L31 [Candidatus Methanomethylicia archaeon]MCQ5340900.1 60S ribosomal protein L31 [Candidatus Methanomethylicia archaeon]NHV45687.1 50S ribosomal protein L31e [Candidatus Verstraetearchaeota archaeon]RZN56271.1 MAG: 50S ribosomal protein L31e [Candidatus Verstraetearchaeota archaeon]TDA40173.1 MAG: 50S ribosomal protein L31e [Candidatus Verstraetearchaeota archaeon]